MVESFLPLCKSESPFQNADYTVYMYINFYIIRWFTVALLLYIFCRLDITDFLGESIPVHYNSVQCNRTERKVSECTKTLFQSSSHVHNNDVYMVCLPTAGNLYTSIYFYNEQYLSNPSNITY